MSNQNRNARNKPVTLEDYQARLTRVLDHIEASVVDERAELDMNTLAEIAAFSPYHFHRIYRAMLGETAAHTVRRLRLHRAAYALLSTDAPVAEIARRAGYGGVEAFGRAFSTAYRLSPTAFRERGDAAALRLAARFPDAHASTPEEQQMPEVAIQELPAMRLAAMSHTGPYIEIGAAFERLSLWAAGAGLFRPDTLLVGVYYDDPQSTPPEKLRSEAGMTIPADAAPSEPAHLVELPAGPHAVLRHVGPYVELHRSYDALYREWLPTSGREPANAPPFEIYRNSPRDTAAADLITDICAPLKPA